MTRVALELRPRPQLTLTPRQQQSVRLLQLPAAECIHELRQALTLNPFLEEVPETPDGAAAGPEESSALADFADCEALTPDAAISPPATDWTESTAPPTTLRDALRGQLLLLRLPPRDFALAMLLIEALDEDGYLREALDDVAALTPVTRAELETALCIVQSLEPPGIGARDVAESLSLQLRALADTTPGRTLALAITRELDRVASRDLAGLRRVLGCDERALSEALALIHGLEPRPGSQVGTFEPALAVPDAIVRRERQRWVVTVNSAMYPRIRVNPQYACQLRRVPATRTARLAQELTEARWLVRNLEQRLATIERVAAAIVARQRNFLEYGELAMRPLGLREIATDLGLHESTVSRAASHKYLATPRGVVAFKFFFSRELATPSGGCCSAIAIRALLRELIAAEDQRRPLSDAQLTGLLAQRGVRVTRRTVTKYRRALQLPACDQRRALSSGSP